jgi:MSHA pilin protein MshD
MSKRYRAAIERGAGLRRGVRGVTLIELVTAITIMAIAGVAVIAAISAITRRGANTMVRQQAVAIAEAYLEEILLQPVTEPAGGGTPVGRANFNDVDQYNNLTDVGAADQFGNSIANLSAYTVNVAVTQSTALTGITGPNARRIDVTVTDPTGVTVMLSGYRANF